MSKPRAVTIKGIGQIHIREISIAEIDAQIADGENGSKWSTARGACRLLCDENGERLLDPDDKTHVAKMAKLPLRVLRAINKAAELDEAAAEGN